MTPKALIIIILVLTSAFLIVTPAQASELRMALSNNQLSLRMDLSLHQNMTTFNATVGQLTSDEKRDAEAAITAALRKATPGADASNLTLNVKAAGGLLDITGAMVISGTSRRHGDVLGMNVSWKDFSVPADLKVGDFSYNLVGKWYLRNPVNFYLNASRFETRPNATIKAVTFYNGTSSVPGTTLLALAGNFTMLNFKFLRTPIAAWSRNYNLKNNTTTWSLTPSSGISLAILSQRANQTRKERVSLTYSYSASIIMSGVARAQGDTILVDVGSGRAEWTMTAIVGLVIAAAVASEVLWRRKSHPSIVRSR